MTTTIKGENEDEQALVKCTSSTGPFTMTLKRAWSPNGYDRAVDLYERGFYDDSHFFRVVPKFLVQFGISYSKDKDLIHYSKQTIKDDPSKGIKFHPGIISYAGSGPNSRTSHLFISYGSAASLGRELWETPIGEVTEGMENVEKFYSYGDMPPWGKGPVQGKIYSGPSYIEDNFPLTDRFHKCTVSRIAPGGGGGGSSEKVETPEKEGIMDKAEQRELLSTEDLGRFKETAGKILLQHQAVGKLGKLGKFGNTRNGGSTNTANDVAFSSPSTLLVGGSLAGVVLLLLFVAMRSRKKESSKSS